MHSEKMLCSLMCPDLSINYGHVPKDWHCTQRKAADNSYEFALAFGTYVPTDFVQLSSAELLTMFRSLKHKLQTATANDESSMRKLLKRSLTHEEMNTYIDSLPRKSSHTKFFIIDDCSLEADIVINADKLRALGHLARTGLKDDEIQMLLQEYAVVTCKSTPRVSFDFEKNVIQLSAKYAANAELTVSVGDWVFYPLMDALRQTENNIVNIRHATICNTDGLDSRQAFRLVYESSVQLFTPDYSNEDALRESGLYQTRSGWKLSPFAAYYEKDALMKDMLKRAQPAAITYMVSKYLSLALLHEDQPENLDYADLDRIERACAELELPTPSEFVAQINHHCNDARLPDLLYNVYRSDDHVPPKLAICKGLSNIINCYDDPLSSLPCHQFSIPMYGVLKYISHSFANGGISRAISLCTRMSPDIQKIVIEYLCKEYYLTPFILDFNSFKRLTELEVQFFGKLNAREPHWFVRTSGRAGDLLIQRFPVFVYDCHEQLLLGASEEAPVDKLRKLLLYIVPDEDTAVVEGLIASIASCETGHEAVPFMLEIETIVGPGIAKCARMLC